MKTDKICPSPRGNLSSGKYHGTVALNMAESSGAGSLKPRPALRLGEALRQAPLEDGKRRLAYGHRVRTSSSPLDLAGPSERGGLTSACRRPSGRGGGPRDAALPAARDADHCSRVAFRRRTKKKRSAHRIALGFTAWPAHSQRVRLLSVAVRSSPPTGCRGIERFPFSGHRRSAENGRDSPWSPRACGLRRTGGLVPRPGTPSNQQGLLQPRDEEVWPQRGVGHPDRLKTYLPGSDALSTPALREAWLCITRCPRICWPAPHTLRGTKAGAPGRPFIRLPSAPPPHLGEAAQGQELRRPGGSANHMAGPISRQPRRV